jgi:hypothetical protein
MTLTRTFQALVSQRLGVRIVTRNGSTLVLPTLTHYVWYELTVTLTLTLTPLPLTRSLTPTPHTQARKLVGTRGETKLGERVVSRLPGPALGQVPPTKFEPGRRRLRNARKLKCLPLERVLQPCTKGDKCLNECAHVSDGARTLLYEEYRQIRLDVS